MDQGGGSPGRQNGGPNGSAAIGTAAALGEVNWIMVISASALAGLLSLLTSVAGLPEVKDNV